MLFFHQHRKAYIPTHELSQKPPIALNDDLHMMFNYINKETILLLALLCPMQNHKQKWEPQACMHDHLIYNSPHKMNFNLHPNTLRRKKKERKKETESFYLERAGAKHSISLSVIQSSTKITIFPLPS